MFSKGNRIARLGFLGMALLCLFASANHMAAKEPTERILKIAAPKQKIKIHNFNIAEVIDNRDERKNIGYLTTGLFNYFVPAYFNRRTETEIKKYLQDNTIQYNSSEALTLYINEYFVHERSSLKGAEIGLKTHYTLYNQSGIKLLDVVRLDKRNTGMNMAAYASLLLRQNMVDFLTQADKDIAPVLTALKAKQKIQVQYVITQSKEDKNIKIYHTQRPVNKFSFMAKVPAQATKDAYSDCGLNLIHEVRLANGKPQAILVIEPYFDQSKSWIKPDKVTEERLDYEQTYFKITAYLTHLLTKELEQKSFTLETLDKEIEWLRNNYQEQLKQLQLQFRSETQDGKNIAALDNWKRKIAFYPNLAVR